MLKLADEARDGSLISTFKDGYLLPLVIAIFGSWAATRGGSQAYVMFLSLTIMMFLLADMAEKRSRRRLKLVVEVLRALRTGNKDPTTANLG